MTAVAQQGAASHTPFTPDMSGTLLSTAGCEGAAMETVAVMSHTTVAFESPVGGNKLRSGPQQEVLFTVVSVDLIDRITLIVYEETYK